jgi:hypothetical protein
MERKRWSRSVKAVAGAALALPLLGVGLIGFAHTPAGRPLLGWLATAAGCPMPNGKATPTQREAFRRDGLLRAGAATPAAARPALGFELEATTLADARAWAAGSGASCAVEEDGAALRCHDVSAPAVGGAAGERIDDLLLSFGPDGRLVAVDAMRRGLRPDVAGEAIAALARKLERDAGPSAGGSEKPPALGDGKLGQASVRFRFSNYAVDLSATSLPWSGVMLREQYSAI